MKKYMLAMFVILSTAVLGMAIAQEKQSEPPKPEQTPKVTVKILAGEVLSVDATKNEVVIKDDAGAETRVLIASSTKITRAGKTIPLGEVKAGEKVTGECEESTDGCKAKSLTVIPPPPSQ